MQGECLFTICCRVIARLIYRLSLWYYRVTLAGKPNFCGVDQDNGIVSVTTRGAAADDKDRDLDNLENP